MHLTRATRCWLLVPVSLLAVALPAVVLTPPAADAAPTPRRSSRTAEPNLRSVRTKYYRIHTDLDVEFTNDLAKRMDAMYEEYQRRLADFNPNPETVASMEVFLFQKQDDYLRFIGPAMKNTGGVYIPGRNLLAAFLEGQGRDGLRRTLQHEAFHQFAFNAISQDMPVWLNEGLSQVFEEGIWTGERFWIGQAPPRRIRQLQADIKGNKIIDFEQLLRMTNEAWGENLKSNHDLGATQYNQSWAMVYFLAHAKDAKTGQPKYRTRLITLLRLLHEGKPGEAAFKEAFSDNVKGFQARFMEFAGALQPTDEATLMERASVVGDLFAELTRRGKKFKDVAALKRAALDGRYRMQYRNGALTWESDPDWRIYFADTLGRSLSPSHHYFEPRNGAALPDLVSICSTRFRLRTRFFEAGGGKFEHEVLVEPPAGASKPTAAE